MPFLNFRWLSFLILLFGLSPIAQAEPVCAVRTSPCSYEEAVGPVDSISIFIFKNRGVNQWMEVNVERRQRRSLRISTGLERHGGTPTGIFRPTERVLTTRNHCSGNVDYGHRRNGVSYLAPMAYAIHFNEGIAIHASSGVTGNAASHGCVRLDPVEARKLYCLVSSYNNWERTLIVVQDVDATDLLFE